MFEKEITLIKKKLELRLKKPYVSADYTDEDKEHLFAGMAIALQKSRDKSKNISTQEIIEIFDAMNPKDRNNMKFPTRRAGVCFVSELFQPMSQQGLLELLDWAEKHHVGYGPRFELKDNYAVEHFKTIKELHTHFGVSTNTEAAEKIYPMLTTGQYRLNFVPIFDSINPHIDRKNLTYYEMEEHELFQTVLAKYEVFDAVKTKFEELVLAFNQKTNPSLKDIISFIKDMLLLHPFPNGNGRTFTLGVLNLLLFKNNLGFCLTLDPHISLLYIDEITKAVENYLISMDQVANELAQLADQTQGSISLCL